KPNLRERNGWFELSTEEMAGDFKKERKDKKGIEYKYRVPMNGSVEYSEKNLLIPPYVLGVWLGDGTSSSQSITVSDEDLEETKKNIENRGYRCCVKSYKDRAKSIDIDPHKRGCSRKEYINSFRENLKKINVLNNKHIPEDYLYSSTEQRRELLKGLMDTDGTISKNGQCVFVQKNKILTEQFLELVRSLGYKA